MPEMQRSVVSELVDELAGLGGIVGIFVYFQKEGNEARFQRVTFFTLSLLDI